MAPKPSTRPTSSLPPSSTIASSMLPSVIRSHHLEDELPLGEGSLASKLFHLEASTQRLSRVQTSERFKIPGSFPASVLPTLPEPKKKSPQVKSFAPLPMSGSFPASILRYRPYSKEPTQRPSLSVEATKSMQIPGCFPVSVLPHIPETNTSTLKPSQIKSTQKPFQVKPSEPIQMPGSFPASTIPHLKTTAQNPSQVKSSKLVFPAAGATHPRSSHRPPSSIRGRPPNILELNAALLDYLSKSSGQIIWGLLKSWSASWGFFKFDRDNVFEVIELLVQDIEHAVAEQTKEFIGRAGIAVERDEILRMVRMLKGMIVRKVKGHLGFR